MIRYREHGTHGPEVVVLHGGPGAPGSAAPLARILSPHCRVTEPWQRGSGHEPLTVDRHVDDLADVVASVGSRPILVGWSWGAMLALAFAARHPDSAARIVLVGCGTFDEVARKRLRDRLKRRSSGALGTHLDRLARGGADPVARVRALSPVYTFARRPEDSPDADHPPFDEVAFTQTWNDAIRLQRKGRHPAEFAAIRAPVTMIHGDYDPHPGSLVRDSLRKFLPHLHYVELPACGHSPWIEAHAAGVFETALLDAVRAGGDDGA